MKLPIPTLRFIYPSPCFLLCICCFPFCCCKGRKKVEEIIDQTWELETAPQALERSKLERLTILEAALAEGCSCDEDGDWQTQAKQILANNGIPAQTFADAVRNLLKDGRRKYRNIMLTGPANCGKSFLLGPVNKIFKVFNNPATSTFAWVGVEEAEAIVLNDFRWTQQVNIEGLQPKHTMATFD